MLILNGERSRPRNESGAVAVMFALLLTFVLIPVAALGVDIGSAVARRTHTQTQADFGAYSAAAELNETVRASSTIPSTVATIVAASMNANQPQDDARACWRTSNCMTAAMLTDGDLTNGQIRVTAQGLQVLSPEAYVDFTLAGAIPGGGFEGTDVGSTATVNIFSVGERVLPMFAVTGCDYGRQTLTDPAAGFVTPPAVPTLAYDTDTNSTELASLAAYNSANALVTNLVVGSTGNTMTLTGKKWNKTIRVGFFRTDDTNPALVQEQTVFWRNGDITATPLANTAANPTYTSNPTATVKLNIPNAVTTVEGVWYIRVLNKISAVSNKWSSRSEALPLRVGEPVLECTAGSVSGNFGTLDFPRTDGPDSNDVPVNIAAGLQLPLTPHVHDWAVANPGLSTGYCTVGVNGAIESGDPNPGLKPRTNCMKTLGGLTTTVADQGFVQGAGGYPGLLTTAPTRTGCDPRGGSAERRVRMGPTNYDLNDDVLTCFLADGTTSLTQLTAPNYSGDSLLIPEIFDSPRFVQVPVLKIQPNSGVSNRYSIIDFRPAFITDEVVAPSTVRGTRTASTDNGLTVGPSGITTIKVIFFSRDVLPSTGDIPVMDFLGVGDRVVRLVD